MQEGGCKISSSYHASAVMCILEFVRDLKLVVTEPGIQVCRTSHNRDDFYLLECLQPNNYD